MGTDPYQVLGVSPNASEDEIRQALAFVKSLDIRAVSQRVMEDLFHALAMRYEFTLPEKA